MNAKPNDIKKHITYGSKGSIPSFLAVNEADGEMWATNKYWLTRAERVAPLLAQYNLPADQPGTYEVNGTVRRANGDNDGNPQLVNVGRLVKDVRSYEPGIQVKVAGQLALVRGGRGDTLFAVFVLADGTHAGLLENELEWLSDTSTAPALPEDCHYGDVRVSFYKSGSGKPPQAVIRASVVRTIEPSHYTDKVEGERQEYVPAVTEPAEPVVLGYMMGMNFGA